MGSARQLDQENGEKKPRILLVDEHVVTAEIERNYLVGVGFEVVLATDSNEASEHIQAAEFDLIMIDTSFRGDKGVEALKMLKSKSKNTDVKSIMTGLSFPPPLKQKVRDAGADELFVKPAPRPQVLKEIKKLISSLARDNERVTQSLSLVMKWNDQMANCQTLDLSADGVHLALVKKRQQAV